MHAWFFPFRFRKNQPTDFLIELPARPKEQRGRAWVLKLKSEKERGEGKAMDRCFDTETCTLCPFDRSCCFVFQSRVFCDLCQLSKTSEFHFKAWAQKQRAHRQASGRQ